MPWAIGLGAAGVSAVGSFFGGQSANAASAKQARLNREFQERMSSTAHQREVADLRAAGLNPILSARLGGSSTPPGATAPQHDVVTPALNSAMQTFAATQQAKALAAQIDKTKEETRKTKAEADITELEARAKTTVGEPALDALEGVVVTGKRIADSKNFDELADNIREATPVLEPIRNKVTDMIEYVMDGGLSADVRDSPASAEQLLRKTAEGIFGLIKSGGEAAAEKLSASAKEVADKLRKYNKESEKNSQYRRRNP